MARFRDSAQHVAVIVSPMLRTLQTAQAALDWLDVPFEANADWQETTSKPCDTGRPLHTFPVPEKMDVSGLDPIWPDKTSAQASRYAYSREKILERGRLCVEELYARREKLVFVVSHSGFLREAVAGYGFGNGDYRVFEFGGTGDSDGRVLMQHESTPELGCLGVSPFGKLQYPMGQGLPG